MSKKEPQMASLRHELLEDVVIQAMSILVDYGIDPIMAEQAGCGLADHLANHWGGQLVSIPKDHVHRLAERDLAIYNRFNGKNHSELAREFNMGVRGIYKVLDRVHRREVDRLQTKLDLGP